MNTVQIIGVVVFAIFAVVLVYTKIQKAKHRKPIPLDLPFPDWMMDDHLKGALISPTKTVYSTHMQPNPVSTVSYKGKTYKVTKQTVINNKRAISQNVLQTGNVTTDITLLEHEPVPIQPVKIADYSPNDDDMVIVYFPIAGVAKVRLDYATESIVYYYKPQPGDSSSPVVNERGELVTINSCSINMNRGSGPNLCKIKDILLNDV